MKNKRNNNKYRSKNNRKRQNKTKRYKTKRNKSRKNKIRNKSRKNKKQYGAGWGDTYCDGFAVLRSNRTVITGRGGADGSVCPFSSIHFTRGVGGATLNPWSTTGWWATRAGPNAAWKDTYSIQNSVGTKDDRTIGDIETLVEKLARDNGEYIALPHEGGNMWAGWKRDPNKSLDKICNLADESFAGGHFTSGGPLDFAEMKGKDHRNLNLCPFCLSQYNHWVVVVNEGDIGSKDA